MEYESTDLRFDMVRYYSSSFLSLINNPSGSDFEFDLNFGRHVQTEEASVLLPKSSCVLDQICRQAHWIDGRGIERRKCTCACLDVPDQSMIHRYFPSRLPLKVKAKGFETIGIYFFLALKDKKEKCSFLVIRLDATATAFLSM